MKTGYVYTVGSRLEWSRTRGEYTINYGADAANVERARVLAMHDIADMQDKPVSENELPLAKASLLRSLPLQRASTDELAMEDLYLSDLGLPLDQPQIAARAYLATTPASLQAVFRKWLRPAGMAQVVKGPPLAQVSESH